MKAILKQGSLVLLGVFLGLTSVFFVKDFSFFQPFFECLFVALIAALTSFFLDFAFREGNIFAFWIRFLNKYFYENEKNPFKYLYQPLGGCLFCMNIWVAQFFMIVYAWQFGLVFLWFFIPVGVLAHLFLNILSKYFDIFD